MPLSRNDGTDAGADVVGGRLLKTAFRSGELHSIVS